MIYFFKKIYYRLRTNIIQVHAKNTCASIVLTRCINSGIDFVKEDTEYTLTIKFKDNTMAKMWNANKYYAWLKNGYIKSAIGEISWEDGRISSESKFKLKKALEKYYRESFS